MSAAKQPPAALGSVEISLRIGQHVRHRDFHGKRVTGVVRGLCIEEDVLHADLVLDEVIVLPPMNADDHELRIYRQHVPAHELAPFDEREELIAEMLEELRNARDLLRMHADDGKAYTFDAGILSRRITDLIAHAGGAA